MPHSFPKHLRQNMTDAEHRLWHHLRARRLKGFKFRRQHPINPYIVDFYCHSANLIIEIDGAHHFDPETKTKDQMRTEYLESNGLKVIRFDNRQVLLDTEGVLEAILRELPFPQPSP